MPDFTDYITTGKLSRLVEQYRAAFSAPILLFSRDRELVSFFPPDCGREDLQMKPVWVKNALVGYVAVPSAKSDRLNFIVQNLSFILEQGYELESLSEEVARNYDEFSLLWRLSSMLASVLDVERICAIAAGEIMNIIPSKSVLIMLADTISFEIMPGSLCAEPSLKQYSSDSAGILSTSLALGLYADMAAGMKRLSDEGLIGVACGRKESLTVCDVEADRRFKEFPYPVSRILVVPLIVEDKVIGAIVATDKLNGEEFYSTEIKLISSVASECAISIKKASLFGEIREILFSAAEAFSFAIDAKDPYTYGHSKRVAELAVKISEQTGISPDVGDWLRLAALLHDIGKIGVPEVILHKAGKLEPAELKKIREHSAIGAKIIQRVGKLQELAKWILHHHEKYDGSGYPDGLKGDDIPLASRIISFADMFDALISDRPYRKAYSRREAVEIMRKAAGEHLDPGIFASFETAIGIHEQRVA